MLGTRLFGGGACKQLAVHRAPTYGVQVLIVLSKDALQPKIF
jgi:hypothetical protein